MRDGAWRKTTLSSFFGAAGLGGVVPSGMGTKHEVLLTLTLTLTVTPTPTPTPTPTLSLSLTLTLSLTPGLYLAPAEPEHPSKFKPGVDFLPVMANWESGNTLPVEEEYDLRHMPTAHAQASAAAAGLCESPLGCS